MPLNPVLTASAINSVSTGPSIHISVSTPSVESTAGNCILAFVFVSPSGVLIGESFPTVTDTLGNTYTQEFWHPVGLYGGAAVGLFQTTSALSGPNVITFDYINTTNPYYANSFQNCILIAEYPVASVTIQDHALQQIYGAAGNNPSVLTVTDSASTAVTVEFKRPGPAGFNGIGTIYTAAVLVDVVSGGVDYLLGASLSQYDTLSDPTTTSPAGYQIFKIEQLITQAGGGYSGYFWDAGPGGGGSVSGQRGNIDWDQIGIDARHGSGGIKVQYSNNTGTAGNLARFLPDGSIGDSGVAAGGASGVGGAVTVNGPATVLINSSPVSFDEAALVNGA
jgi:hypothetical protein